jgi:hypothetical protein
MIHSSKQTSKRKQLHAAYRAQLSSLIELERVLVQLGYLRPDERRVLAREERRTQLTKR